MATTAAGLGIRNKERLALTHIIDQVMDLLGSVDNVVPSRAHPLVQRLCITCEHLDPLDEFDIQMRSDYRILVSIRNSLSRTKKNILSPDTELTAEQMRDLGLSLVVARLYLAWQLGLEAGDDNIQALEDIAVRGDAKDQRMAHIHQWCALVLSRINGEAHDDDPDFGL